MTVGHDYGHLNSIFSRPVEKVKSIDVDPIPQRIFDGMKRYEEASRGEHSHWVGQSLHSKTNFLSFTGFDFMSFEHNDGVLPRSIIVSHKPRTSQLSQLFRIPFEPSAASSSEHLTHFDLKSGRTISAFRAISGEDWRGVWRSGGAIMAMDVDGSEMAQLW